MKKLSFTSVFACLAGLVLVTVGCRKNDRDNDQPKKPDIVFYALTSSNKIVKYNAMKPEMAIASVDINGLESAEMIISIDFRPATGQLYGLGKSSRLYTINPENGKALAVGTGSFSPAISGESAGFDFNPTVDRIRLVTNSGQNLRLHPETGAVAAIDGMLNPGSPMVNAVAYTNSFAGASSTTLFDIDIASQKLMKQSPPNDGTLVEVGMLGVMPTGESGFDISPDNKVALAALTVNNENGLYHIDTATGKALKLGKFNMPIIGIAIPTNPVAYAADDNSNLHIFNFTAASSTIVKPITGLQAGEKIWGLDMRPATGQLYALGSTYRIYTINMASGAATAVAATPFTAIMTGTAFGFDFNPTVDRIRLVSNTGENLRLHPVTGVLAATDAVLNPATPMISGAAYTNNFAGATTTVLFDIDPGTDKLYKQDPPNNGTLVEVGPLGINAESAGGFDIGGTSGKAYALLTVGTATKIYSIDLNNGMATAVSDFPAMASAFTVGLGF